MLKPMLTALVVASVSSAALAVDTPLPNGSFETNPAGGFTQTITNWSPTFVGTPAGALPANQYSGLFTSYGKFNVAPNGGQFLLLDNLGGGVATIQSGASGTNFLVNDRNLAFRYAYMSNDAASAATHDQFRVHIDFFATASSTIVTNSIDLLVADRGTQNDTAAGISPFGGANNPSVATFNNANGNTFNLFNVDVTAFFNQFARVSFIVNNLGPAGGTAGNGLGVSGAVIDNVVLNPEPSTVALFAAGLGGLGLLAWRKRQLKLQPVKA
jgi:hypothetical protein